MVSFKLFRCLLGPALAAFHLSTFAAELVADPTWQSGKLANGFSWQILTTPQRSADNVEIRLVIKSGSLNETVEQSGYNHLLTKLALTPNVDGNSGELPALWLSKQEQPHGLSPAVNSYEFTQFNFSLPVNKPGLIKDALHWLAATAGELPIHSDLIHSALVAPERSASFPVDTQDEVWRFRIKDSGLADHDPMALPREPVIREKLLAFYQQWYTPDAMTLYVVGNVESRSVIEAVNKNFSKLTGKREKPSQMVILSPLAHQPVNLISPTYASPSLAVIWDSPWSPIQDSDSLNHYWLRELVRESVLLRLNGSVDKPKKNTSMACHVFYQRDYCELNLQPANNEFLQESSEMMDALASLTTNGLSEAEYQQLMNIQTERLAGIFLTYAHLSTRNLIERRLIFRRNNVADIAPEQFQKLRKLFLENLTLPVLNQAILQQLSQPSSLLLMQKDVRPTISVADLQKKFEQNITANNSSSLPEPKTKISSSHD